MPILNYTSKVAVAQTAGEIQSVLARRGVTRISTLFDEHGAATGLAFTMRTDYGPRDFELPVRADGVLAAMMTDPGVPKGNRTPEQAARTAWRIAKDWLEAQVALIDANLASLDEVLFPYMVDAAGTSAYVAYRSAQKAIGS